MKASTLKVSESMYTPFSRTHANPEVGYVCVIDNDFYSVISVIAGTISVRNVYPDAQRGFHTRVFSNADFKKATRCLIVEDFNEGMAVRNIKTGEVSIILDVVYGKANIKKTKTVDSILVFDLVPHYAPVKDKHIPRASIFPCGSMKGNVSVNDVYCYDKFYPMMKVVSISSEYKLITVILSDSRVRAMPFEDFLTVASKIPDSYYMPRMNVMYGKHLAKILERDHVKYNKHGVMPTKAKIIYGGDIIKTVNCSSLRPHFPAWNSAPV